MNRNVLERLRQMDADKCLFLLGNVMLVLGMVFGLLVKIGELELGTGGDCMFRRITGMYCMGCGGTRATLAYLHGHILTSIKYNAFVAYGLTFFFFFMGSHYLRVLTKGRIEGLHFKLRYVIIGVVILTLHFIVRNIMLINYGSVLWPIG